MSNQKPFTLEIFVADGDPDGLRIVERTNWSGKAVIFPRAIYPEVREREEFIKTGVYLLLGPQDDGDGETIYIGEGDPVRPRLENHHANKDFWTRAVFFVASSGKLNKAHVQYLEARLVNLALAAKRMPMWPMRWPRLRGRIVPTMPKFTLTRNFLPSSRHSSTLFSPTMSQKVSRSSMLTNLPLFSPSNTKALSVMQ